MKSSRSASLSLGGLDDDADAVDLCGNVGHRGAYRADDRDARLGVDPNLQARRTGETFSDYAWDTISLNVAGTGGIDTLRFESRTGTGWGAAIDQVELVPVPEPATMTLLAAGVLGLLRRRRTR